MKKYIYTSAFVFSLLVIAFACQKEELTQKPKLEVSPSQIENNSKYSEPSRFAPKSDQEIIDALSLMSKDEAIIVSKGNDGAFYWSLYNAQPEKVGPDCKGSGYGFAKCCQALLDEGTCLLIRVIGQDDDEDNIYGAWATDCPE